MRRKGNRRAGYTYTELTMVALIVGIVTAVSVPDGDEKTQDEVDKATKQWEADVAYARAFSTSHPDDPMVLKIDVTNNHYWLALKSNPSACVTHPITKKPFDRCFQPGGEYKNIQIIGADVGDNNVLEFKPSGELKLDRNAVMTFQAGSDQYEVSVSSAAADVKCTKVAAPAGGGAELGP